MQALEPAQAQGALAIPYLRDPAALADAGLDVAQGPARLRHAEDGVGTSRSPLRRRVEGHADERFGRD